MHPPLDRPHPDCQDVIVALRECHATKPWWKIWACNEAKFALDRCFRAEKQRRWASDQANAPGHFDSIDRALHDGMSFADYLKQDKIYNKEMQGIRQRQPSQNNTADATSSSSTTDQHGQKQSSSP